MYRGSFRGRGRASVRVRAGVRVRVRDMLCIGVVHRVGFWIPPKSEPPWPCEAILVGLFD